MPTYDYTISSFKLPNNKTVEIKDEVARNAQQSGMHYLGVTTSSIVDGSTTNPIAITGKQDTVTAVAGDIVTKSGSNAEYLFDGTTWHEMGDLSTLGALAQKDSASGTYTPAGSISGGAVILDTDTKYVAESATGGGSVTAGSASVFSATVSNEELTFGWTPNVPTAVTLPSFASQTIATDVDQFTDPTFTGTQATITVS